MKAFCEARDLELSIRNENQHWIVSRNKFVAEWWPSTGRVVINKRWNNPSFFAPGNVHEFIKFLKKRSEVTRGEQVVLATAAYLSRLRDLDAEE